MFYNYIIRSSIKKFKSTKPYRPYNLIFVQITDSKSKARDLEKFLKIRWNKESLLELVG